MSRRCRSRPGRWVRPNRACWALSRLHLQWPQNSRHQQGKSFGVLSAISSSLIRVTAGIIQLDGLTFSSGSYRWPLQKNGDLSLLVSFAVESDVSSRLPVGLEDATRISTVPMVLRSGFYLFFMSAMILLLSYKVGSCIYSR